MKNEIYKEIEEIAPTLSMVPKDNPFKVPDDYFSSLENKTWDALDKKPHFSTAIPSGYFDSLSDRVLEQVEKEKKPKVIPIYRRSWLAIAACMITLLVAGFLIQNQSNADEIKTEEFALEFEVEEALDYLAENEKLYLSDLAVLKALNEDQEEKENILPEIEYEELEDILDELSPEDLEELL